MDPIKLARMCTLKNLSDYHGRIIVVSNRLPVTCERTHDGKWNFKMSSGGLVAGLEGVKKKLPFIWIGWTGSEIPEDQQEEFKIALMKQQGCLPVFLPEKLADQYYNGFSNGVLWPLFHYLLEESGSSFTQTLWHAYVEANRYFADVVANIWQEGDLVWIHDYHLMKLPQLLRERLPNIRLGFFLHIPLPSSEVFQVLPVRKAILKGLLNCDLIGFHTYDYARHFLSSCTRLLGLECTPSGVTYHGRYVPVEVFPVGIDPEKFQKALQMDKVKDIYENYRKNFAGKKVILGVDRLDYIKGIPHKLKAFELFLKNHPELQDKVVLIQIAVPSRTEVEHYKLLKNEVDALVGRINGTYGSLAHPPVLYLFQSVPFDQLCALYKLSDVCVISSIRDGMNLVAQEYIACQTESHGVLILSEFAGSANALSGSIIVNPWAPMEVATAIHEALTMEPQEKANRHQTLYKFIATHTACDWGESFIKELDRIARAAQELSSTPKSTWEMLHYAYQTSKKRLLVFASDGALIPFVSLPFLASPSKRTTGALAKISQDPKNTTYIVSGRDRNTLANWFSGLPVGLIAEHGFFTCERADVTPLDWNTLHHESDLSWKQTIKPIFEHFTERTPGSFFEEKETSLTWHYRFAERDFGSFRAAELQSHLDASSIPVMIVGGQKTIEARPYECNYTSVLKRILHAVPDYDFMLYIGYATHLDFTDDPRVWCVSVGVKGEGYYLENCDDVLQLVEYLLESGPVQTDPYMTEIESTFPAKQGDLTQSLGETYQAALVS